MSDNCLDTDALVSVAAALEWDVPARLDHLASCDRCRADLAGLAELQAGLRDVTAVSGFKPADVAAAAQAAATQPTSSVSWRGAAAPPSRRAKRLLAAATFLVAATTTSLLVLLLAGASAAPLALALAAAVGSASILPIRLPVRRQEA